MQDSTFELINLAASDSFAAFCLCNLIIAVLLVSSKSSSQLTKDRPNDLGNSVIEKANISVDAEEEEEESSIGITTMKIEETPREDETEEDEIEEERDEEDDDDDELTRRVEEFIRKINNGWRAEKLRGYTLGQ